jgi:uroporphyrinogen-III decarboxylase
LEPAREADKIIVIVSDGRFEELIPDLIALGIHGIQIDTSNDLQSVLERYGDDHAVVGNIDTQILTWGGYEEIKAEVGRCAELGKRYPGYMFKAAGDLPHNIPMANIEAYVELKRELGRRD